MAYHLQFHIVTEILRPNIGKYHPTFPKFDSLIFLLSEVEAD